MLDINEKEGMGDDEFEIYTTNSIVPIFPYAKYIPGKRVIIKIDIKLVQKNIRFLAKLRNLVFLIYPVVTNTPSVSQETNQN